MAPFVDSWPGCWGPYSQHSLQMHPNPWPWRCLLQVSSLAGGLWGHSGASSNTPFLPSGGLELKIQGQAAELLFLNFPTQGWKLLGLRLSPSGLLACYDQDRNTPLAIGPFQALNLEAWAFKFRWGGVQTSAFLSVAV